MVLVDEVEDVPDLFLLDFRSFFHLLPASFCHIKEDGLIKNTESGRVEVKYVFSSSVSVPDNSSFYSELFIYTLNSSKVIMRSPLLSIFWKICSMCSTEMSLIVLLRNKMTSLSERLWLLSTSISWNISIISCSMAGSNSGLKLEMKLSGS